MNVPSGSTVPNVDERARAVGAVLGNALDADDARLLLQFLDLDAQDVARYAAGRAAD